MELPISISYLWSLLKRQKEDFLKANILGVISSFLFLPIPILIPLLIDEVLLNHNGSLRETLAIFQIDKPWEIIASVLSLTIILRGLVFWLNIKKTLYIERITHKVAFLLRVKLLRHLERLSVSNYENLKSGTIISRTIHDIESISDFIGSLSSTALSSLFMLIGILAIMFSISWQLTLLVLILNPIFFGISKILGKRASKMLNRQFEAYDSYQELLGEILELFIQIKASAQEYNFFTLLKERALNLQRASIDYGYQSSKAHNASTLITNIAVDIFKVLGIGLVAYGNLTIGMMLGFLFYLSSILSPIQQLMNLFITYRSITPAIKRLNELLSLPLEPHSTTLKNPFIDSKTVGIKVDNIYFSYPNGKEVIRGISLDIKRGSKVALIGESGGGKTTIAKLLVGFYTPQVGKIYYDSTPIEEIGLRVIRQNVALMLQESMFFNDTIRANLTFGHRVSDEKIFQALKYAKLDSFIASLPNSLETQIGKNGIRLSGGQKQRLAIARLILQNPKVVIFDEATSALDGDTEFMLYETLREFLRDKTTIIIAHRATTIRQADFIYIVERGRIKASGSYESLKSRGLIRESYDKKD